MFRRVFASPLGQQVLIPPTGLSAFVSVCAECQIFSCCISRGVIQLLFITANAIKDQAHYLFAGGGGKEEVPSGGLYGF